MALSTAAYSSGRRAVTFMAQALGAVSSRGFASGAVASQPPAPPKRPSSIVEPAYTYMPPGSSMREPLYFSTSDPVYFVDPKPDAQAVASQTKVVAEANAATTKPQEGAGGPVSLRKFDFSEIAGKHGDDGRPVSYRMVDDFAQQGYIVNPSTHSMREPKYVSVSDPKYTAAEKPKK